MECAPDESEDNIKNMAQNKPEIAKWLEGKAIKRVIFIKNKLLNIVIDQ